LATNRLWRTAGWLAGWQLQLASAGQWPFQPLNAAAAKRLAWLPSVSASASAGGWLALASWPANSNVSQLMAIVKASWRIGM